MIKVSNQLEIRARERKQSYEDLPDGLASIVVVVWRTTSLTRGGQTTPGDTLITTDVEPSAVSKDSATRTVVDKEREREDRGTES